MCNDMRRRFGSDPKGRDAVRAISRHQILVFRQEILDEISTSAWVATRMSGIFAPAARSILPSRPIQPRAGPASVPGCLLAGYRPEGFGMIRAGACYNHEPHATEPLRFMYVVGDPSAPVETWAEGLSMFHNPRALVPLPRELFPGIAHHWPDDQNRMRSVVPTFPPLRIGGADPERRSRPDGWPSGVAGLHVDVQRPAARWRRDDRAGGRSRSRPTRWSTPSCW